MGVLSLRVRLLPHVPAGPALAPAPIAASMPVTASATLYDRSALTEIEASRSAE